MNFVQTTKSVNKKINLDRRQQFDGEGYESVSQKEMEKEGMSKREIIISILETLTKRAEEK